MSGEPKIYMGNIADDCRERDVEKFFKGYGRVSNIVLKGGYGFCQFDDMRDAEDAVKDLDGKHWLGSRVKIELARGARDRRDFDDRRGGDRRGGSPSRRKGNPPGRRTGYRVVVENLSSRTSWQDLKDFMRQAGEITYTNTHHIRSGEGIVEFGTKSDMEYALDKLDDSELDGRRIKLTEESNNRSRSRSHGGQASRGGRDRSREKERSRDRSRGRSRSRSRSNRRSRSRS